MENRVYNFSAGPAMMPPEVLQQAREEMFSLAGSGMSVMEISHRSALFERINAAAQQGIRDLLDLPDDFHVLFLQGGATSQFSMIPLNFLSKSSAADYVVTGTWGKKAVAEALHCGMVNQIYSSADRNFAAIPEQSELRLNADARYVHYTSNETIEGVEFKYDLEAGSIPVVCDASSNILSKPIDVSKYSMIYAGAQKNLGPSGVTVIIIRDDFMQKAAQNQFAMLDYRAFAAQKSLLNTPNTWGIYLIGLVCEWLKKSGGLSAIQVFNEIKAKTLYDAIDDTDFYQGYADKAARSTMNVTFHLPNADLDEKFCAEAAAKGFNGLAGHRSLGGVRASIYNAFPLSGVKSLIEFMRDFEKANG